VNLTSGVVYVGDGTGEGRAQAAGADGRPVQTGCGRGYAGVGSSRQDKIALSTILAVSFKVEN